MLVPIWVHLAALCMIALVALVISLPLLRSPRGVSSVSAGDPHKLRWVKEKDMAFAAIKEAEFDFQMGKLSPEDYQALRSKYEERALRALAQLEELEQGGNKK